jgi:uncharacterized membrane protein
MRKYGQTFVTTMLTGIVIVVPVYLGLFLLLKAIKSLAELLKPVAALFPAWMPGDELLSLLLVLAICFLVGIAMRTAVGRDVEKRIEHSLLEKIPGYSLFRSLTQRLTGETQGTAWKPAFAEIEEALVPAFIIEEHADGCFTVFVPSVPTPFAGGVYVLPPDRVHPVNVSFTQALRTVSRWGLGCKDMVAAMEDAKVGATEGAVPSAQSVLAKYETPTVTH